MYKNKHHQLIISFFLGVVFILSSCQEDPSRHINLGDWYFTGDYPTPGGNKVVNKAFINWKEGKNERAY